MSLFDALLKHFLELSKIPRPSKKEGKIRDWVINWAKSHNWDHQVDAIGNLLVLAKGSTTTLLCLQSHLDMVCVSRDPHDWSEEGVEVIEENGILRGNNTTLGADNGIGIAAMMTIAELKERPNLELLFTVGEEIGLIGAHSIDLPLTAEYAINLDWCHSGTIGTGCGGTLLMEGMHKMPTGEKITGNFYKLQITGMQGGHSGVDIHENRGNAIVEWCRIVSELPGISGVAKISGGDADNAIPRSTTGIIVSDVSIEVGEKYLSQKQAEFQERFNNSDIHISLENTEPEEKMYGMNILTLIGKLGDGIQIWGEGNNALSSWNLGKIKLTGDTLAWCYFLRTNIPDGIEPMKEKIMKYLPGARFELSHEGPVWLADSKSPFVQKILETINDGNIKIPAMTTHATVEVGTLAEKFPDTEWISIGATCHNMHTTEEHIYLSDIEEFATRLEKIVELF